MTELKFTAKDIAIAAHHQQTYGDAPYMDHVEAVVRQVVQSFGCQPYLTDVAYLHDVLEDGDPDKFNPMHLSKYVSRAVLNAVILLSKDYSSSYEEYIRRLVDDRDNGDQLAWKVKVADTLSNLAASVLSDEPKRVIKYSKQLELLYK